MSPSQLPDDQLISLIITGDQKAFDALFLRYYKVLAIHALRFLGNEQESEEVVQDIFVDLWQRRKRLIISHSTKAYLYQATKYQCLNLLRKRKIHFDEISETDRDESSNIEAEIFSQELAIRIQRAIDSLPPRCQAIFRLSRHAGMSYREIAEELEISVKTVEAQMGIALKRLRKVVEK